MTRRPGRDMQSAMGKKPQIAFVLAAGLGTRMRPLTDQLPKPLVPLAGRPLLDHVLDRIGEAGIAHAIVNVHYRADQIEAHLAARTTPRITISDERAVLLETGGGAARILPLVGPEPFLIANSDTVWLEAPGGRNITRLIDAWDADRMDGLLLLADAATSLGYAGRGDFVMNEDGRLQRVAMGATSPFVFAGVSIAHPRLFDGCPDGPFSLNRVWDRAIAAGRLFGHRLDGLWMHVGDPAALAAAQERIARDRQA